MRFAFSRRTNALLSLAPRFYETAGIGPRIGRLLKSVVFFALSFGCFSQVSRAQTSALPLPAPRQAALNPCFAVTNSGIRLVDGTREQALELVCGGVITWDIPQDASSFHVTLWRAEPANAFASSQPTPTSIDPVRVLIAVDGKPAADTVLRVSTPAETWVIPTLGAHSLSIETEQEYGAFGVYLGDPGFSPQPTQAPFVRHVLGSGQGYVNLGTGPRQVAYFDFHPGETVPIQAEFAGNASRADVEIQIAPLGGAGARTISVPIALHAEGTSSVGSGQWQVPPRYGPANIHLTASVSGRQIYSDTIQAALAKAPDVAAIDDSSNFGIHQSTGGSLCLHDDEASLWGAKRARFFLAWDVVEAKQGQYDWHWIDNVVQSYSAQHLTLLGVMGELPPKWITDPASQMRPAYAKFVNAALEHFKGKIKYWEVYNEIDAKFYSGRGFNREAQPSGDIDILHQELEQMEQFSPSPFKVCCAPGGSDFLAYEKRLFDAGLIGMIDAVAMHPYQSGPPEESDFGLSYLEMANRLGKLAASYGESKPVWSTEANWLIGPAGTPGVMAPQVTEHEQSQYLVRVNLLSLGVHVPLFTHSPFNFPFHRSVLVDSLASYTEMTSLLSGARNAKLLSLPAHLYGISANTPEGTVAALWADSVRPASARISGLTGVSVQDMYGNPLPAGGMLELSGSPIYVVGQGIPVISGVPPQEHPPRILPPVPSWKIASSTRVNQLGNGVIQLTGQSSSYARQLTSPVLNVTPGACYVIQAEVKMHKGGVDVAIVDPDTNKSLRNEYIYAVTGNDQYNPEIRVKTPADTHLQLVFTDSNPHAAEASNFEVGNVTMSDCP